MGKPQQIENLEKYIYVQKPNNLTEQEEQEQNIYKQVPGWSLYEVNAFGELRNIKTKYILKGKDENKLNCYYQNLEWCTSSYNNRYNEVNTKNNEILLNKYRKKVYLYDLEGNFIKEIFGVRKCAREIKTSNSSLVNILNKNKKDNEYFYSTKGFIVCYEKIENKKVKSFKNKN